MSKYKLTKKFIAYGRLKLYRIQALEDFADIVKGEKGGYIESSTNLSQTGNAWVSGDAQVFGDARVFGDAQVSGDARVFGDAQVSGDAWVLGNARVFGNAWVSGDAQVFGDAQVSGDAQVFGDAQVSGDAQVFGDARVRYFSQNHPLVSDIFKNLPNLIFNSLGIIPTSKNKYICYKSVRSDLISHYDEQFKYKVGKIIKSKIIDPDLTVSCGGGLHVTSFAHLHEFRHANDVILECEVDLKDIITCLGNKIRCSKLKVIRIITP